jgi:uncharacterized membrane protein
VYASFPEKVGVYSNEVGEPAGLISRNTFFYISLLFIIFTNGVFVALVNLVKKWKRNTPRYKEAILIWLHGMISFLNIFFIVSLVFYNAFNSLEDVTIDNFGYSIYLFGSLSLLWIIGFIFVIRLRGK